MEEVDAATNHLCHQSGELLELSKITLSYYACNHPVSSSWLTVATKFKLT